MGWCFELSEADNGMTRLDQQEAGKLAQEIINATKRGEPLPSIPDSVPHHAVKHCVFLGEMYRELDRRKS